MSGGSRRLTFRDTEADRNADGTLKAFTGATGEYKDGDKTYKVDDDDEIPDEVRMALEKMYHGTYDSAEVALGSISEEQFMLLPNNFPIQVCPLSDWGAGPEVFKVNRSLIVGIYALAKAQAKNMGFTEEKAIKWALLRMQAYEAGWFDHQKHAKLVPMPPDAESEFAKDEKAITNQCKTAYRLAAFIPFFAEFYFRCFGAAYSKAVSADYENKIEKIARSALMSELLHYTDNGTLYGGALSWIGMKRPMQVLRDQGARGRIPSVFHVRARSGAAGQSLITTAAQAIRSLAARNWWAGLKEAGGYDDVKILRMSDTIQATPWRYHMWSRVYGMEPLNKEEEAAVNEARKDVELCAPVLQAFIETTAKGTALANAKVLKKLASRNIVVYQRALTLFKRAGRRNDAFTDEMFIPKKRRLEGGGGEAEKTKAGTS